MFSKNTQKNAQVSMEYLFVIAFFLLLVTPIFFFSYTQLNWHNRYNQLNDAVATLAKTADDVCALGDDSIQYAVIQLPQGIEWTSVTNKTITIHTRRFGDTYAETKCEVEGDVTTQPGVYHIALTKKDGKVYINKSSITCDLFYGTATENSGATDPDNALTSDDNYAVLPSNTDYVRTLVFNLNNGKNKGNITSVEIAMEYHREGTYVDDDINLSYYINTTQGATLQGYGDASSDTTVYLNVTNDTSWTWDDINALKVEGMFVKRGLFEDYIDWYVDVLFTKICYWTW